MRKSVAIIWTVVLIVSCAFAAHRYFPQFSFRIRAHAVLNTATGGELPDISPLVRLFEGEWERSPERFAQSFSETLDLAEMKKIEIHPNSVLRLFELSHPDFCGRLSEIRTSDEIGAYCEGKTLPSDFPKIASPDWGAPDCSAYRFSENRDRCSAAVNAVLSSVSDAHCSVMSCKNDIAAFLVLAGISKTATECSKRPSPALVAECSRFVEAAKRFSQNPPVPSEEDVRMEAVLAGNAEDPVSRAVRRAFFSENSSPADECAFSDREDRDRCRDLVKTAFAYSERERETRRFRKILDAVSEYRRP